MFLILLTQFIYKKKTQRLIVASMDSRRNTLGRVALCFLVILLSFMLPLIKSQVSIPPVQDGFWYGGKKAVEHDSVLIEAFFDPVCPDSRDSWTPLKMALHKYGFSRVSLVLHTFPLPYHDNAFATSRALHIVNKLNTSAAYDLLEAFFDHQEHFFGSATLNMSRVAVVEHIVKFATDKLGTSYHSAIKSGFTDSKTDHATRFAFKYGCLRGVYGTPFFFVNGFPLPDAGSPIDYKGWRKILDPLVNSKKGMKMAEEPFYFM